MRRRHDDDRPQGREELLPPGDDFLQAHFHASLAALGLPAGSDFVDRTLRRVLADRSFAGAAGGDDAVIAPPPGEVDLGAIPAGMLASYVVPEPSADFVDRTLARLGEERREPLSDLELERLLARHESPHVSADFVARTLAALRGADRRESSGLRLLPRTVTRHRAWLAAAAVLVLGLGAYLFRDLLGPRVRTRDDALVASTFEFSPSQATTVFARQNAAPNPLEPDDDLDFRPLDGLTLLAAGLARSSE